MTRRSALVAAFAFLAGTLSMGSVAALDDVLVQPGEVVTVGNGTVADVVLAPGETVTLRAAPPECTFVPVPMNPDWTVVVIWRLVPGDSYAMWATLSRTPGGPSYYNDGQSDQVADSGGRIYFVLKTGLPGYWDANANPSGTPRFVEQYVVADCQFVT